MRPQLSIEFAYLAFLTYSSNLVSLYFEIGIICMTIHSGTLSAWSLLKLSFGMCASSPPYCASASSRFSWWSFISSTASWAFSVASVRSHNALLWIGVFIGSFLGSFLQLGFMGMNHKQTSLLGIPVGILTIIIPCTYVNAFQVTL